MTFTERAVTETGDWLFAVAASDHLPAVEGLIAVRGYVSDGRPPEEVALMERAQSYGARAVFFETARHGRAPVAQALIFDGRDEPDDDRFAELHRRL